MCQSVRQITKWPVIDNTINRDVGRNPPLAKLLTHNDARRIAANITNSPELATALKSTFSASVTSRRIIPRLNLPQPLLTAEVSGLCSERLSGAPNR